MGLQVGDVACYPELSLDEREFHAMALFEVCERQDLIGKTVTLTFGLDRVLADSCFGDPECPDTQPAFLAQSIQEASASSQDASFKGLVGHLEDAVALTAFVDHQAHRIANLDLTLTSDVLLESPADGSPFFVLWTECDPPEDPEDDTLGAHRCGGIEYQLGAPEEGRDLNPLLADPDTGNRLKGRFQIGELLGPHQGLFALRLTPLEQQQ